MSSSFAQAHAPFRQKAFISLFEFTLTHRDSAKEMAELGVGLQPNVACEFKRAGFLEWRFEGNTAFANLKDSACNLLWAMRDLQAAAAIQSPSILWRKFAALQGVRLLHHLADSGQGCPA